MENAKNKAPVVALREIAADHVRFDKDVKEVMSSTPEQLRDLYGEPVRDPTDAGGGAPIAGSPRFF